MRFHFVKMFLCEPYFIYTLGWISIMELIYSYKQGAPNSRFLCFPVRKGSQHDRRKNKTN